MIDVTRRVLWVSGWPFRVLLLGSIRGYQLTVGRLVGGRCRFYPSCSTYALGAVRNRGGVIGSALSVWRLLRCSPLSAGGFDYPPSPVYDTLIHRGARS